MDDDSATILAGPSICAAARQCIGTFCTHADMADLSGLPADAQARTDAFWHMVSVLQSLADLLGEMGFEHRDDNERTLRDLIQQLRGVVLVEEARGIMTAAVLDVDFIARLTADGLRVLGVT